MQRKIILLSLLVVLMASSCIPRKRLMYLQDKEDQFADSLIALEYIQPPYRLQINDLLSIRIKAFDQDLVGIFNPTTTGNVNATTEEDLYFNGYKVDRRGEIKIPYLGNISVIGKTLEEVEEIIEEELLKTQFKSEADLNVTVMLPGIRYTTLGEIGSKGGQIFYKEQVNIFEAIANAGDIGIVGDRKKVRILRQYPEGRKIHQLDLTDINVINSPYYYIQPNDIILVDPLPQKTLGLGDNAFGTFTSIFGLLVTLSILSLRLRR